MRTLFAYAGQADLQRQVVRSVERPHADFRTFRIVPECSVAIRTVRTRTHREDFEPRAVAIAFGSTLRNAREQSELS